MSESTRWSMIEQAARGKPPAREEFAHRYGPVIRAYLGARWNGSPLRSEIDDASQEVFWDCFKEGGALERVDPEGPGRFRSFLYGVVRNVALRVEDKRRRRRESPLDSDLDPAADDDSLGQVFDRAWASALLQQAVELQVEQARDKGPEAERRVEILYLRFDEGLPIREIAARWDADPAQVHRQYATARREFQQALHEVVRRHDGGTAGAIGAECARLLDHLE